MSKREIRKQTGFFAPSFPFILFLLLFQCDQVCQRAGWSKHKPSCKPQQEKKKKAADESKPVPGKIQTKFKKMVVTKDDVSKPDTKKPDAGDMEELE